MGAWERWPSDVLCVCICSSDEAADYSINLGRSSGLRGWRTVPIGNRTGHANLRAIIKLWEEKWKQATLLLAGQQQQHYFGQQPHQHQRIPRIWTTPPASFSSPSFGDLNQTFLMVPNWSYHINITKSGNSNSWIVHVVIEACLQFEESTFDIEKPWYLIAWKSFFFHYFLKNRRLGTVVMVLRACGFHPTIYRVHSKYPFPRPISVVGKKRTLRICSLLCSHLSLEAPEERKHTWAIFQNIEPSSSAFSTSTEHSFRYCQYWLTDWTDYGSSFNLQFNFYLLLLSLSLGSPRALRESLKATSTTPFFHTFIAEMTPKKALADIT